MRTFHLAALMTLVMACANPGIVKISPDTYFLSKEDHAGIFGSMAKLKADVISEANAFAEAQGKVALPITSFEKAVGNTPGSWARFDYQFRVVEKNDPEVRRVHLTPRPDLVIEKTEKFSGDLRTKDLSEKPRDLYLELMKLDDLRKRGILSEEEFEAQKRKLLAVP